MIFKRITYFGQSAAVACDARCDKAWGRNNRPCIELAPDDPDDTAYLADGELGIAPADPGTYEGGDAKPRTPAERLNKWCVRECERCRMTPPDGALTELPDFSTRQYNMPWKHQEPPDDR